MLWFQHSVNAHQDIKLRRLRRKYAYQGIGRWWTILEMIGQEGAGGYLSFKKYPKEELAEMLSMKVGELDEYLTFLGEIDLIDPNCLPESVMCHKLPERADDYTKRLEREQIKEFEADAKKLRSKSGEGSGGSKKSDSVSKDTSSPTTILINYYRVKYKDTIGIEYPISWGRDGKIMKELLCTYDIGTLKELVDEFIDSGNTGEFWHSDKMNIPVFKHSLDDMIGLVRKKKK